MFFLGNKKITLVPCKVTIDSFHIIGAHGPNSLVPHYLHEITREGATFIRLPHITQWNVEKD